MKTMRRTSMTAMVVYGAVLAPFVTAAATLTGTGVAGIYGFGLLFGTALLTFLMWPERTRFFVGRSQSGRRRHDRTRSGRNRPRAL